MPFPGLAGGRAAVVGWVFRPAPGAPGSWVPSCHSIVHHAADWSARPGRARGPFYPCAALAAVASFAACFSCCFVARTSASDAGPVMSATERRAPSWP